MPISVSQHIGVSPEAFAETGAFDAILDVDSRLFIDPHLLQATAALELQNSYARLQQIFTDILRLLAASKRFGDVLWREATRRFTFPELEGLCIGYAAKGTSGRGMGRELRRRVLVTAKEIVDAGIQDPVIFELVGLFEEGVGADRISDMTGRLVLPDLLSYSQRIFSELGAPLRPVRFRSNTYRLAVNPFNRRAIILMPIDILRDLPIAHSFDDIDVVCAANRELRARVNKIIGATWRRATTRGKKHQLRRVLLSEPDVLRDLLEVYKRKPRIRYDFADDPAGEVIWYRASHDFVSRFPLKLMLSPQPTRAVVLRIVLAICEKFKRLIEHNGLADLLYEKTGKHKRESAAQKLFYGIADAYCESNDLDLSPEANAGRGPVDFKISRGYATRVVVETKLTTNPKLLHGFRTQLAEYQKAEQTKDSVYLVIDVGGSRKRLHALVNLASDAKAEGKAVPKLIVVDAKPKASASRYKSQTES